MKTLRNTLALAGFAAVCLVAACSDSSQPIQPASKPSLDGGVTVGTGNRSDSTIVRTNAGSDTSTAK